MHNPSHERMFDVIVREIVHRLRISELGREGDSDGLQESNGERASSPALARPNQPMHLEICFDFQPLARNLDLIRLYALNFDNNHTDIAENVEVAAKWGATGGQQQTYVIHYVL
jgi:hypothetical protein